MLGDRESLAGEDVEQQRSPGLTQVWFAVDTLRELAKHSQIVGIKDSSGDIDYFAKICQLKELRPDWSIFVGPEHLLAQAVGLGGDGGVNGGANVDPELFVSACWAALNQDMDLCQEYMKRIDAFQAIYKVGAPGFRFVTATKCALAHKGICGDFVAPPLLPFSEEEKRELGVILESLK